MYNWLYATLYNLLIFSLLNFLKHFIRLNANEF
ncbi:hypothetical protein MRGR3_1182 [Staphylococcus aureus subsp. aureus MRGR3]|nr:hypothetical protein MRGR3_1182 [Staphylococcus aureus subsp. aureus MRGR3]